MGLLIFGGRGSAPVAVHYGEVLVIALDGHVGVALEFYVDEFLEGIGLGVRLEKEAAGGFARVE